MKEKCRDCGIEFEPKWEPDLFCPECRRKRAEGAEENRQRLLKYFESLKDNLRRANRG